MKYLKKHRVQDVMSGKTEIKYIDRGEPVEPQIVDDFLISTFDQFERGFLDADAVGHTLLTLSTFKIIEGEEYVDLLNLLKQMIEKKTLGAACPVTDSSNPKRL